MILLAVTAGIARSRYLVVAALSCVISVTVLWSTAGRVLYWDEVDYAIAAQLGVVANAVEAGSMSPGDFVRFVQARLRGTAPDLPAGYDEARDPLVLRHYHPPLVVAGVSLLAGPQDPIDERRIRAIQMLGAIALILAIAFAHRQLSARPTPVGTVLVTGLAAYLSVHAFLLLHFHGWLAVWTVLAVSVLVRFLKAPRRPTLVLLAAVLALASLTLESAAFVILGAVIAFILSRYVWRSTRASWAQLATIAVATFVFVVVLWPGAIFGISLVKIPALYAYRIVLGQEYSTVASAASGVIRGLLPYIFAIAVAVLLLLRTRRETIAQWGPFIVIALAYAVVFARFAYDARYLAPAVAAGLPLVGLAVDGVRDRRAAGALLIAVAAISLYAIPAWWQDADDRPRADIDWLRSELRGRESLVDGGHIAEYYLGPEYSIERLFLSADGTRLRVREDLTYRDLGLDDLAGKTVVILARRGVQLPVERELLADCSFTPRPTLRLYDCPLR